MIWNLTPIEERWEAVEESERTFRAQRLHRWDSHSDAAIVADPERERK
jgi:hypothetical protein